MENISLLNRDSFPITTEAKAIVQVVYSVLGLLVGVAGNGLIVGVYWTKQRRTRTTVLIVGLAWNDLLISVLRVRSIGVFSSVLAGSEASPVFSHLQLIEAIFQGSAILITSAIAVDRFNCVFRQHKWRQLNTRRARTIVGCSYLAPTVLSIIPIMQRIYRRQALLVVVLGLQVAWYMIALLSTIACYGSIFCHFRQHSPTVAPTVGEEKPQLNRFAGMRSKKPKGQDRASAGPSAIPITPVRRDLVEDSSSGPVAASASIAATKVKPQNAQKIAVIKPDFPGGRKMHPTAVPRAVPIRDRFGPLAKSGPSSPAAHGPGQAEGRMITIMQRKITRMMCLISVLFLVTWLPYVIYAAMELRRLHGEKVDEHTVDAVRGTASLVYLNNVANPFIYSLVNKQFRRDCRVLIRKIPCLC